MILHNIIQSIFVAAGLTALLASLFNWEWFFATQNAGFIVKSLGRKGSRILYGAVGALLIVAAIYFYYRIKDL